MLDNRIFCVNLQLACYVWSAQMMRHIKLWYILELEQPRKTAKIFSDFYYE